MFSTDTGLQAKNGVILIFLALGDRLPEMKPIRHTKTARLRALKMYRDDLDELVKLFQKCASLTISDNENEYGSLDEMKNTVGPKIINLDIRGENPGLHFLLNQKEYQPGSATPAIFNELRTEETSDAADNLFREIKDFLFDYQRPKPLRFLIPPITAAVVLCIIALYAVVTKLQGQQAQRVPVGWGMVVFVIVSILSVSLGIIYARNYLRLETKRNSASFYVRNREEFAKHAVTAAITGIVGWLLGHFGK